MSPLEGLGKSNKNGVEGFAEKLRRIRVARQNAGYSRGGLEIWIKNNREDEEFFKLNNKKSEEIKNNPGVRNKANYREGDPEKARVLRENLLKLYPNKKEDGEQAA